MDPWGEVLADCGDSAPNYQVAEITDRIAEVRRNMPVFQHRRLLFTYIGKIFFLVKIKMLRFLILFIVFF